MTSTIYYIESSNFGNYFIVLSTVLISCLSLHRVLQNFCDTNKSCEKMMFLKLQTENCVKMRLKRANIASNRIRPPKTYSFLIPLIKHINNARKNLFHMPAFLHSFSRLFSFTKIPSTF